MAMIYLGAPLAMPRHLDDGQELVLESLRLLQCPDMSSMNQTNWFIFIHCHVYDISGWYFMCSSNGMCVWRNVEGKPGRMSCTLSKRDASLLTLLQCPDRSLMNQTNWFISTHCHVFNMSGWMDYLICFSWWEKDMTFIYIQQYAEERWIGGNSILLYKDRSNFAFSL